MALWNQAGLRLYDPRYTYREATREDPNSIPAPKLELLVEAPTLSVVAVPPTLLPEPRVKCSLVFRCGQLGESMRAGGWGGGGGLRRCIRKEGGYESFMLLCIGP